MADYVSEREALDIMEPRWSNQGYTVLRQPKREDVPEFLGRYRPDAIAIGKNPNLVIEVVNPRNSSVETKISQIQSLFANHTEWKLEVVYTQSSVGDLAISSWSSIESTLDKVEALADHEPRAALLLAWASLEASGRVLYPNLSEKGMAPDKLIDLLVSNGVVNQQSQSTLKRFGQMRNMLTHGDLDIQIMPVDVYQLVEIVRSLNT